MPPDERASTDRRVLVVDDHDPTRQLLVSYLGGLGCQCAGASGGSEALAVMSERTFDLVLLDLRMDDLDGLEVLKRAKAENLARNFVMMSAEGTIAHAVDAIRLGATDFLVKPFELEQLDSVVTRVLRTNAAGRANERDPRLTWRDKYAPNLIGEHSSLLEVFLVIERIAATDCTVLILGESGTGKELVAHAIHSASNRVQRPFVPVNCGAIPETLIESELFGHAKGSFSGATSAREGRFAVADTGTLFLDEIGEMSLSVQVKFLRVLQEGEFVPVGETRPRKCDVRIIAATNKDLESMAEEGTFREDLFYRLNLIPIHLPPLRERVSDVPLLVQHFLQIFNQRRGRTISGCSPEAIELLSLYTWPGNVREMENTIERMSLLHQGSGVLDVGDLPPKIQQLGRRVMLRAAAPVRDEPPEPPRSIQRAVNDMPGTAEDAPEPPIARPATVAIAADGEAAPQFLSPSDFRLPENGLDLRKAVEEFEMSLIEQALERTGGNKNQASLLLDMNRTTLVEKLRKRQKKNVGIS